MKSYDEYQIRDAVRYAQASMKWWQKLSSHSPEYLEHWVIYWLRQFETDNFELGKKRFPHA